MTNIQEIAQRAGVSPSTASRALSGRGYVSEEKKQRVLTAAAELDYAPNLNAVSLKTGSTRRIGLVAPRFTEPLSLFTTGLVHSAEENGYTVTLFMTGLNAAKEVEALEALRRKQVDALVFVMFQSDLSLIADYVKYGPIVCWQRVIHEAIPSVFMNQYDGYMLALEHLYERGYRRICNVYGATQRLNTQSRMEAFADFCRKYDLDPLACPSFENRDTARDGEQIVRWWLENGRPADAFACTNDWVASGIIAEARRLGLRVPEDFAVCGFDNLDFAPLLDLTTIHYPVDEQASNAFAIIRSRIEDIELPTHPPRFRLVERLTT
ncbi:LacI family transcriptional regulator [Saccharibacillus sp. O16]|nr:LacI family transcriptional regulator [Saccharibacillus sp. O16]